MPLLPYRFFLPYRFAGYLHLSQSKRFMHMRPQNTIEDVVSLFGENLHGKVINGPWCLKMAFGLILLSFCYRFVHADIPTNTQRNAKHVTNMDESHTTSARIMMVTYVDTYIHIHTYVYIYIYVYTHECIYICIYI